MGRPKKVQTETKQVEKVKNLKSNKTFQFKDGGQLNYQEVDLDISDGNIFQIAKEGKQQKQVENETEVDNRKITMFDPIYQKYLEKVNELSDINELLPKIFEIATFCDHCTEMGVRRPTSTYAFLAAKPKRVVSYDIGRYDEEVSEVERLCKEAGQDFEFILGSSANVTIEETDCILIDTLHTKKMLETELALHADKVRKFILLHDTFGPYWETGEAPYNDETSPYGGGLGLKYAIEPFLESHPEWTVFAKYDFNNGLMILKRND